VLKKRRSVEFNLTEFSSTYHAATSEEGALMVSQVTGRPVEMLAVQTVPAVEDLEDALGLADANTPAASSAACEADN